MIFSTRGLGPTANREQRAGRRARPLIALLLLAVFGVLVAACGSSPSASSTSSTSAPGNNTSAGSTASSTTIAPTSSTAATTTTVAAAAIGAGSQFCQFAQNASKTQAAATAAAASAATGSAASAEASLKTEYATLQKEEPAILSAAPAAIKPDFQTIFTFANSFYGELAKVGYDFTKLPTSFEASLAGDAAKVSSASTAISTYLTKSCGLKSPGTT